MGSINFAKRRVTAELGRAAGLNCAEKVMITASGNSRRLLSVYLGSREKEEPKKVPPVAYTIFEWTHRFAPWQHG